VDVPGCASVGIMWVQSNTEHGVWLQATGEAEAEPLYISLADANKTLEV
jgi:hypothetical protein